MAIALDSEYIAKLSYLLYPNKFKNYAFSIHSILYMNYVSYSQFIYGVV